jgi:hypothetical protein
MTYSNFSLWNMQFCQFENTYFYIRIHITDFNNTIIAASVR